MAEAKRPGRRRKAAGAPEEPFDAVEAQEAADTAVDAREANAPREYQADRRPWEKQPWESTAAFHGFSVYRDLGFTRSLTKAAQAVAEAMPERAAKPESIRTQMSVWSSRNRWVERAEQYDLYVDARLREQREGRIDRQNRRYETAAATMSGMLLARIAGGDQGENLHALDLNELDAEAAARVLVNLQRVERLATGQPTELAKGAFLISSHEVERIARELVELAMQFVPEERQPLYAQAVQAYANGGGQGRLAA